MKAITLKQPWASAISHLTKRTENRTWPPKGYTGDVAIHAGQTSDPRGAKYITALGHTLPATLPTGAVVAVARITGYHSEIDCPPLGHCWQWGMYAPAGSKPLWHWLLDDVRPIEPVPCAGSLGFWTLPERVEAAVQAQLAATVEVAR